MTPAIFQRGDALTVPVAGNPSVSADRSTSSSSSDTTGNDKPSSTDSALSRAVIAISVIMAVAMIVVVLWYLRERRNERGRDRDRRIRLIQSPRSVLPLQTSFHPSLKSSFGFTGASPDSPWSRTDATITPLSRAAGQETLFSPLSGRGSVSSPQQGQGAHTSALPQPPATANTQRTFRTDIRSVIVNRDSATVGHQSLGTDFFPSSPSAHGRPRLTRLPSYHTDYAKTSPYIPDQKKGFLPGPDSGTNTSTDFTSTMGGHDIPPVPIRPPSSTVLPTPTTATCIHAPRNPRTLPPIRTRMRESALEYLNGGSEPSSTASLRAMVNTSEPPSARPSRGDSLSEDLRGLLFLGSSVTVEEQPLRPDGPAAPDLSPTRGWSRLPETTPGRRLV